MPPRRLRHLPHKPQQHNRKRNLHPQRSPPTDLPLRIRKRARVPDSIRKTRTHRKHQPVHTYQPPLIFLMRKFDDIHRHRRAQDSGREARDYAPHEENVDARRGGLHYGAGDAEESCEAERWAAAERDERRRGERRKPRAEEEWVVVRSAVESECMLGVLWGGYVRFEGGE